MITEHADHGSGTASCSVDNPASGVIREILAKVGDKWSMLVIGLLHDGPLRFTALQRSIDGISHRMLTQTLRSLERDGLITRTSYPEIPPRVEYAVTDLGRSLAVPVIALAEWASDHHPEIMVAREKYERANPQEPVRSRARSDKKSVPVRSGAN